MTNHTFPPRPAPPAAPRSARRLLTGVAVAVGCAAIIGGIAGLDEVADRIDAEEASSQKDASIRDCSISSDTGALVATVAVTNHSSGLSTYAVEVTFTSPGDEAVDRDDIVLTDVEAGRTIIVDATSDRPLAADAECHIAHVDRFSA
jgi:hypothetical protein